MSIEDRLGEILTRQDQKMQDANARAEEQLRQRQQVEAQRQAVIGDWQRALGMLAHAMRALNEQLQGRDLRLAEQMVSSSGRDAVVARHQIVLHPSSKFVDHSYRATLVVRLDGKVDATIASYSGSPAKKLTGDVKEINMPFFSEVMIELLGAAQSH